MSVYGGDSWAREAREAQHRKRKVDELMIESFDSSIYKKLHNGKFVCLVCPTNPVLDSPITLSTHVSGSRHRTAELRRKSVELAKQEEVKKRLPLSGSVSGKAPTSTATKQLKSSSKPLIELARKAVLEVISGDVSQSEVKVKPTVVNSGKQCIIDNGSSADPCGVEATLTREVQPLNYRLIQEKELKFTAAGWKRDCRGGWFKDENVEFDSTKKIQTLS